jgi:hypothetical protein
MSIAEAEKYIRDLHRKQKDPSLWPDYLTGLPDKAAVIKKMDEINPKLGEYSIVYIRIANIHPYLLYHGPGKHAEIVQWAAAIIKTTCDICPHNFVGTFDTHDFVLVCRTGNVVKLFKRAQELFRKKTASYYSPKEVAKGLPPLAVGSNRKKVSYGLMKLIAVIAEKRLQVKKSDLIRNMARMCDAIEGTEDEMVIMSNDNILRE